MSNKSKSQKKDAPTKSTAKKANTDKKDAKKSNNSKKGSSSSTGTKSRLTRGQRAVVIVLACILAFSTVFSIIASVYSSSSSSTDTEEATTDDTDSTDSTDDEEEEEDEIAEVDETYTDIVNDLLATLEDDPDNEAAILNLGRYYFSWGVSVANVAEEDEDTDYANELLDTAIDYYDQYLELEDSSEVKVDKALCLYYQGDSDAALEALEDLVAEDDSCPLAWANLGYFYEVAGDEDAALEAYNNAVSTDPDDEYGAKSYAEERIEDIESEDEDDDSDDSSSSSSSSLTSSGSSLSDTLSSITGTDF